MTSTTARPGSAPAGRPVEPAEAGPKPFAPIRFFAVLKADSWPDAPPYMNVICGEGTEYASPDDRVPIHIKDSISIPPDDPRLTAGS